MSLLFEPTRIGPLEVKNRFVHSATYECMAGTDGEVTDELVPLMLVGAVRNLNEMEEVVRNGKADFVSMSRPLIREPFLVKRLREGKAEAAACISCNKCFAAIFNNIPLRCYVDGLPQ